MRRWLGHGAACAPQRATDPWGSPDPRATSASRACWRASQQTAEALSPCSSSTASSAVQKGPAHRPIPDATEQRFRSGQESRPAALQLDSRTRQLRRLVTRWSRAVATVCGVPAPEPGADRSPGRHRWQPRRTARRRMPGRLTSCQCRAATARPGSLGRVFRLGSHRSAASGHLLAFLEWRARPMASWSPATPGMRPGRARRPVPA